MRTWRVEYETMTGTKTLDVAADKVIFESGRAEFYRDGDLVAWVDAGLIVAANSFPGRLAQGGVVKPAPWRAAVPRDEEEIFIPSVAPSPYRMRYDDDPIGDAARDAAKRFEPKVTSAALAHGELGGRCA